MPDLACKMAVADVARVAGRRAGPVRGGYPVRDGHPVRAAVQVLAAAMLTMLAAAPAAAQSCVDWPQWNAFANRMMQADGRVVDFDTPVLQSTSEGQSYALFFALVANDRASFDRVLRWTEANLAEGSIETHLPAWQWGRRPDGSWGTLDTNSASDADLWIAYALLEAGRLWRVPAYAKKGQALIALIRQREVVNLPAFGEMLSPGQNGFHPAAEWWRVNPSYLPLPVLRRIADSDPGGPWGNIAGNTVKMALVIAPRGFAPDWVGYRTGRGFVIDPVNGDIGSYDAIRVYLWAGMTSPRDALAKPIVGALRGMHAALAVGAPPERIATATGAVSGVGPVGFSGALLPYLKTVGDAKALAAQQNRIASMTGRTAPRLPGQTVAAAQPSTGAPSAQSAGELRYYDRVLLLFGQGWLDGRYRFEANGRLAPRWENSCQSANAR